MCSTRRRSLLIHAAVTLRLLCVYGDDVPDIPRESRCDGCGRVILYRFITVRYDKNMKPVDMD